MRRTTTWIATCSLAAALAAGCGDGEAAKTQAAGETAAPAAAPAAAATNEVYSCNRESARVCTEYTGKALFLGPDMVKGTCEGVNGTFAKGGCPSAGALGSCAVSEGTSRKYYPGGPLKQDAAAARNDCVDIYKGSWTPAAS